MSSNLVKLFPISIGGFSNTVATEKRGNVSLYCRGNAYFDTDSFIDGDITIGKTVSVVDPLTFETTYTNTGGNINFKINDIEHQISPEMLTFLESADDQLDLKADKTYTDSTFATITNLALKSDKTYVDSTFGTITNLALKADKTYSDSTFATITNLALKADKTYSDSTFATITNLSLKSDKTYVDSTFGTITNLALKSDKTYTDSTFATITNLNLKAPLSNPSFTGTINGVNATLSNQLSLIKMVFPSVAADQRIVFSSGSGTYGYNGFGITGVGLHYNVGFNTSHVFRQCSSDGSTVDNMLTIQQNNIILHKPALFNSSSVFTAYPTCTSGSVPSAPNQLITKSYADSIVAGASILSSNNAFTGTNSFNSSLPTSTQTPTSATQLVTKAYADSIVAGASILSSNNAFTGTNSFNSSLPTSTQTPTSATQLVTKSYTDGAFATIANLNLKANQSSISNIDNTSDANKIISNLTQAALNLKANLASPSFSGIVGLAAMTFTNTIGMKLILYSGANSFESFGLAIESGIQRYNLPYNYTHRFSNGNASSGSTSYADLFTINRSLTNCLTPMTISNTLGVSGVSTLGVTNCSNITASGSLQVTGTSTLGTTNCSNISASGNLEVTGTANIYDISVNNKFDTYANANIYTEYSTGTGPVTGCSINSGNGTEGSDTWIINKGGSNPILGGFFFCTSNSVTGLQTVFEMTGTGNANFNAINDVPTAYYDPTSSIQTQLDSKTTTAEMMGRANTWTNLNTFVGTALPVTNTNNTSGMSIHNNGSTSVFLARGLGGGGGFQWYNSNYASAPVLSMTLTHNSFAANAAILTCGAFQCPPVVNSRKIVMYDSGTYSFFGLGVESGVSRYNVIYNATHRFSNANAAGTGFENILSINRSNTTCVSPMTISNTLNVSGTSTLGVTNATNINASGTLGVTGVTTLGTTNATNITASVGVISPKMILYNQGTSYTTYGLNIESSTIRYNVDRTATHKFSNANAGNTGFEEMFTINRSNTVCSTPLSVSNTLGVTGTTTLSTLEVNESSYFKEITSNSLTTYNNEIISTDFAKDGLKTIVLGCTVTVAPHYNRIVLVSVPISFGHSGTAATGYFFYGSLNSVTCEIFCNGVSFGTSTVTSNNALPIQKTYITNSAGSFAVEQYFTNLEASFTPDETSGKTDVYTVNFTCNGGFSTTILNPDNYPSFYSNGVSSNSTTRVNLGYANGVGYSAGSVTYSNLIVSNSNIGQVNVNDFTSNGLAILKKVYYQGQPGAFYVNGTIFAQHFPIYYSVPNYTDFYWKSKASTSSIVTGTIYNIATSFDNLDDFYCVMPGFTIIVYSDSGYTGEILNYTNNQSFPQYVQPTEFNAGSSCKLFFGSTLL